VPTAHRRRLRFLPLAPLAVVVLGIATAVVVGWVGVAQLREQDASAAAARARALAETLGARLSASASSEHGELLRRARAGSLAEFLLLRRSGELVARASDSSFDQRTRLGLLARGSGDVTTPRGPARFALAAVGPETADVALVALVPVPDVPDSSRSLIGSVAALTWILVGAAALVAFAIARDVRSDVEFVRARIGEMAEGAEPAGKLIPVRSIDQIGLLTASFNALVERFTAAELAYRQDLAGAEAYDRDRAAFLAALSHELRTPLNAILGFTDVLLSEVDGTLSDDTLENLDVVRSSGEHLRELIDDILELSALESGELELNKREVDLLPIAEEVMREARVTVQDKPLQLDLEGKSTVAWGDARRIRQILSNLVDNAVKFTAEGRVHLSVEPEAGGWAVIRVTDTGPGIAANERSAIFEEYRQAGDAAARRAGSGLGLAITRRLVQMHGGTVELESSVGAGSTFSIWLPARAPESSDSAESGGAP
jgi:signal transduction histidine kinase